VRDEVVPSDRAVLDRVVDGATAVLLVGPDEWEAHVEAAALPPDVGDGTWLIVDPETSPVEILGVDEELTARRTREVSARMQRLREHRRGGRFRR
jgi:hypothetical protein